MDKNKTTERILPHNIESEQSVLCCAFIDPNAAMNILSELKENDFYIEAHKHIFNAMYSVYSQNGPIDIVTIMDALEKANMVEAVGGATYITSLTNFVPSSANYTHYIDIIKRNSILRQLISAGNDIISYAFKGVEKQDAINYAEKAIFDISRNEERSSLVHIKDSVYDVMDKFQAISKDKTSLRGVPTGFYALDKITNGLQNSDLILLAARPACGKTTLALNIANYAAVEAGKKVAVFSLEMPRVQLAQRALCSIGMVSMERALKGELSAQEWKNLWAANEKLEKSTILIDDNSLNTPMDILSKCRRMKAEVGLDLVVIDYLQLMECDKDGKNKENRQLEISDMTRKLKIVAKELDVPVLVLSQLSRAVEARKDHKPILSDLRESGSIEQNADIVMFIHRPATTDTEADKTQSEIIIAKHRNGPTGSFNLKFRGEYTRFMNMPKDSDQMSLEKTEPAEPKQHFNKIVEEDDVDSVF